MKLCHFQRLGHARTLNKNMHAVSQVAFWIRWKNDVRIFLQSCIPCANAHSKREPKIAKINSRIFANRLGSLLCIDTVTLNHADQGFKYLPTMVDGFSRYLWIKPLKTKSAIEIAGHIVNFITEEQVFDRIHSDNGPEVVNDIVSQIQDLYGFKHTKAVVY